MISLEYKTFQPLLFASWTALGVFLVKEDRENPAFFLQVLGFDQLRIHAVV